MSKDAACPAARLELCPGSADSAVDMTFQPGPIPSPFLPTAAVLLASAAVSPSGVPRVARVLLPALVALGAGMALFRSATAAVRRSTDDVDARVAAAEARNAVLTKAASQMRHDLRGILSPALLTADRLAMSQDPASRRAGEVMIMTVERAEQRLRAD